MGKAVHIEPKELSLIKSCLGFVFALVVFPSNIKAIVILIFALVLIYFALKNGMIINKQYFFVQALFYFTLLATLLYSENLSYAFKKLQTMSSLIVFPLLFSFFSNRFKEDLLENRYRYLQVYIITVFLFNVSVFLFFWSNYFSFKDTLIHMPEIVNVRLGKYSIHPIYISMHCALALLFSAVVFVKCKRPGTKPGLLLIQLVLLSFLMVYARKGPIIALIGTILISSFLFVKKNYRILGFFALLLMLVLIFAVPNTRDRFKELLTTENLAEENANSTDLRQAIYTEAIGLIQESPVFGYGIGDYNDKLKQSYKEKDLTFLLEKNYNAHNQYLSSWLIGGLFSFLALVFLLGRNFFLSVKHKNHLLFLVVTFYMIVMFTENILEREDGVIFFSLFLNYFALLNYKPLAEK
jgi:O-antigen ligase